MTVNDLRERLIELRADLRKVRKDLECGLSHKACQHLILTTGGVSTLLDDIEIAEAKRVEKAEGGAA